MNWPASKRTLEAHPTMSPRWRSGKLSKNGCSFKTLSSVSIVISPPCSLPAVLRGCHEITDLRWLHVLSQFLLRNGLYDLRQSGSQFGAKILGKGLGFLDRDAVDQNGAWNVKTYHPRQG